MSTHNRDRPARLEKLESIEARLNRHIRAVKIALAGLSILGTAVLALLLYHIISL
jgi:hypothetical protein